MGEEGGSSSSGRRRSVSIKSFAELNNEIRRTSEYLERWVYPSLKFGAVFWIPNVISGFGDVGGAREHPFVIVVPYRKGYPTVVACPGTSKVEESREKGLLLPGGVVSGLERDGVILLGIRRSLIAAGFGDHRYAGDLPRGWQQELRAELNARASEIERWSEEP